MSDDDALSPSALLGAIGIDPLLNEDMQDPPLQHQVEPSRGDDHQAHDDPLEDEDNYIEGETWFKGKSIEDMFPELGWLPAKSFPSPVQETVPHVKRVLLLSAQLHRGQCWREGIQK